jgi:hypothetical protein
MALIKATRKCLCFLEVDDQTCQGRWVIVSSSSAGHPSVYLTHKRGEALPSIVGLDLLRAPITVSVGMTVECRNSNICED